MFDEYRMEDLVIQGIYVLRDTKRKRPTKKDIYIYVQEFFDETIIDFDDFLSTIANMEERRLIINKGKGDKESYYISKEFENSILTNNSSSINKTMSPPELMTPELNTPPAANTPTILTKDLNEHIDIQINKALAPFISKLSTLIKEHEQLSAENKFVRDINNTLRQTTTNETIESLKKEIIFLKNELSSKNKIIEIMQERNTIDCVKDIQKKESDINKNSKGYVKPKTITVIGDSCIKDIKTNKLKKHLGSGKKMFIKSFPGATVKQMIHYVKPSLEYNPNLIVMHCGTNDLRSEQPADAIAESVVKLAATIKTDENDILISGLTPRSDKHGSKCLAVNDKLKKLCEENNFEFIDNSNIKIKEHLSSDGLHLNLRGTIALSKNFCDAVSL